MSGSRHSTQAGQAVRFLRWRPHPWHGLSAGENAPGTVNAYVEINPFDHMKYEVDKESGYLRLDRPQMNSSLPPCSYGFIPRTLCAERVRRLSKGAKRGDGDPMDICIVSELPITRAEVLVHARVVGGFRMVDDQEADDKIIAVLDGDTVWDKVKDIDDLPESLVSRMKHYFLTYKMTPKAKTDVTIESVYGAKAAIRVVAASIKDYAEAYPDVFGQD